MKKIFKDYQGLKFKSWIIGGSTLLIQFICYLVSNFFNLLTGNAENSIAPKIATIDDAIPFVKIFILIYIFSFYFWVSNATILIGKCKKSHIVNCYISLVIATAICALFFIFMPTHIDRVAEGSFALVQDKGFLNFLCRFIFANDGWETGRNLFPSMHCLDGIFYALCFYKQENITKGRKIYCVIIGILICASTVLTKQHYFIDMVAGALLAIVSYIIVLKWNPGEKIVQKNKSWLLKII